MQPFSLRLVGLSTIQLVTSDKTHPIVIVPAIPNGKVLREQIRTAVEERRDKKGVREMDLD